MNQVQLSDADSRVASTPGNSASIESVQLEGGLAQLNTLDSGSKVILM